MAISTRLPAAIKHCKTTEELHTLAESFELAGAKAILKMCEDKLSEERRAHEKNLKVQPEFVHEHPYFQLGVIDGLKWVLSLPIEAKKTINKVAR